MGEGPAMATGQASQRANPINPSPRAPEPLAHWGRPLAIVSALLFLISSAFPVTAGLSRNTGSFPQGWGVLDVGVAFALAFLVIVLIAIAQGNVTKQAEDASYRAYRFLIHGLLVMLMVFFLFGERIV
jgi:hypothetical protein